jgi:hypothetical protein
MDQNQPPPLVEEDRNEGPPSPHAQIAELVGDVRALAEAEWEYTLARLTYSGGVVRKAGIYALLALLAISAAAFALVVGTLLIIASYWGPWEATGITVAVFSFAAFLFSLRARSTAKNLSFAEPDDD